MITDENSEARPVARVSQHRPAPFVLPDDPKLATAALTALIRGSDSVECASAIEALTARAAQLADLDPEEAIISLAEQLVPVEALWHRMAAESVAARTPEARAIYARLAISALGAYSRLQTLVIGLRLQSKGKARVVLTDDGGDDS